MKVLSHRYNETHFRLLVNMARNQREGLEVFRKIGLVADRFLNISIDYIGFIPDDDYVPLSVCRQRPVVDLYPQAPASQEFQRLARLVEQWPATRAPKGGVQFYGNGRSYHEAGQGRIQEERAMNQTVDGKTENVKWRESDRERVIREFAPVIKAIAHRLAFRLPAHLDADDLISVGIIGLMDAMTRYDPTRGSEVQDLC